MCKRSSIRYSVDFSEEMLQTRRQWNNIFNTPMIPAFDNSIQHSVESPSQRNKAGKRNKKHLNYGERKLSLFADDMILNLENPKELIIY